ncbi:MAG: hypothetical protein IH955_08240 [Chloroflexi bacterium]|nr:hypothetical protein [Chloroflexota bacterium]
MDGKKITRVTIPHDHKGDVKKGTLASIRRQVHLDNEQFADLVDCPLTRPGYETILKEKRLI